MHILLKSTLLALPCSLSTVAHADLRVAQITLDTVSRSITVQGDGAGVPDVDWLTADETGTRFVGTLPELQSPTRINGWSENASYLTGGGWLPALSDTQEDHSADVAHEHDITVTVPATNRVAVTGEILSDTVEGDQRHVRFRFDGPSAALGIFVGTYEVGQGRHDHVTLRTYLQPEDTELSAQYLAASGQYIDRYSAQIGPFPYPEFSVVSAPIPVGLGFAGATYIGQSILPHSYMTGRSLAHEVLHNWWGNAVRVEYATGNWSEGLTTFMADYALAEDSGVLAAQQMRMEWLRKLALIDEGAMKPLADFRSASHDRGEQGEGYGKAALVFHMLRADLGRDLFYDGLRQFYRDNAGQKAGWAALQQAFEEVSGRDLSTFFAQWIGRVGLPRLQVADVTAGEGNHVLFTLTQDAAPYALRVPVVVQTHAGAERHHVRLSAAKQRFDLQLQAPAQAIHIDPDFDLARWPAAQELSPTLDNAFAAAGFNAALAAPDAPDADEARALLEEMLNIDLVWDGAVTHPVDLIFGTTAQVDAYYQRTQGRPFPEATVGAARAWLEQAEAGRMTLYISADDLEDAAAQMRFLGYYGSKSYVTFVDGSGHTHGVMPSRQSVLRVAVD